MTFRGRVALVTGAGSGIGRLAAQRLATDAEFEARRIAGLRDQSFSVWASDRWTPVFEGGVDPQGPGLGVFRLTRSDKRDGMGRYLMKLSRMSLHESHPIGAGIRLVRTLPRQ